MKNVQDNLSIGPVQETYFRPLGTGRGIPYREVSGNGTAEFDRIGRLALVYAHDDKKWQAEYGSVSPTIRVVLQGVTTESPHGQYSYTFKALAIDPQTYPWGNIVENIPAPDTLEKALVLNREYIRWQDSWSPESTGYRGSPDFGAFHMSVQVADIFIEAWSPPRWIWPYVQYPHHDMFVVEIRDRERVIQRHIVNFSTGGIGNPEWLLYSFLSGMRLPFCIASQKNGLWSSGPYNMASDTELAESFQFALESNLP